MRKLLIAALVALLPMNAFAQNQPARPTDAADEGGWGSTWAVAAGAIGGLVVADLLIGGGVVRAARAVAPAAPSPAAAAAFQAGAVLGTELMAATARADARVVNAVLRFLGLTTGAVAGAYAANTLFSSSDD